jgi:hypothetical protein
MMRVQTCRKCRKFEMLYSTCTSAGIGEKKIREERVTLLKVIYVQYNEKKRISVSVQCKTNRRLLLQ